MKKNLFKLICDFGWSKIDEIANKTVFIGMKSLNRMMEFYKEYKLSII